MWSSLYRYSLVLFFLLLPLAPAHAIRSGDPPIDGAPVLDGRYHSADSGVSLSFEYPEAWFVSGDIEKGVVVSNMENPYYVRELAGDEAALIVVVISSDVLQGYGFVADPSALLGRILSGAPDGSFQPLGDITAIRHEGFHAASVAVTTDFADILLITVEQDGSYIVALGLTAVGGIPQHEATFYAIARTIRYQSVGQF